MKRLLHYFIPRSQTVAYMTGLIMGINIGREPYEFDAMLLWSIGVAILLIVVVIYLQENEKKAHLRWPSWQAVFDLLR